MKSICLSSASILRCESLTRSQNIYLIIPTALEVIFSTSLAFIDQGPGKWAAKSRFFFLLLTCLQTKSAHYGRRVVFLRTCGSWTRLSYPPRCAGKSSFIQRTWFGHRWVESALIYFIPHLNLQSCPGILSLLPISWYTIFLYLITNAEIVSALPRRIKNLTVLASIFFILLILVFNEIAAITGVSIRESTSHTIHLAHFKQRTFVTGPQGT